MYGRPTRRGQIVELLGRDQDERYRVRWDEKHESILYPADGVVIIPNASTPAMLAADPAPRPVDRMAREFAARTTLSA